MLLLLVVSFVVVFVSFVFGSGVVAVAAVEAVGEEGPRRAEEEEARGDDAEADFDGVWHGKDTADGCGTAEGWGSVEDVHHFRQT